VNEPPEPLWDDPYIEKRWKKKPGFMSDLRKEGRGPRFLRLSPRTVRYRPPDVRAYEDQQEFQNTAESLASDFKAPPPADLPPIEEKPKRNTAASMATNFKARRHGDGSQRAPPIEEIKPKPRGRFLIGIDPSEKA
jgi:hypothetical protein